MADIRVLEQPQTQDPVEVCNEVLDGCKDTFDQMIVVGYNVEGGLEIRNSNFTNEQVIAVLQMVQSYQALQCLNLID